MRHARAWILGVASLVLACEAPRVAPTRSTGATSLVLIHTADLHSHLFPERLQIGEFDAGRGLGRSGEVSEVGGFARIASIVSELRAGASHSLFLDSGDLIEGTATYRAFGGEAELRAFSALSVGAAALGNHDLDPGAQGFAEKHQQFATFPVLAANFAQNGSELSSALRPSVKLDAQGLKVGVIGVANPNSPSGLEERENPYGVTLLATASAVQTEIERLRSEVDVIVAVSHLGLDGDEALIRETSGLDIVLGGHQHLALDEALERFDCGPALQARRGCRERRVFLVHSGALGRYVGEVDLALSPGPDDERGGAESDAAALGLEVDSALHTLLPVSADVAEDPKLAALLEPYRVGLRAAGFDTKLAFALARVERYGASGGDSALGDWVTDAIRRRTRADVVLLNSSGFRADLPPGELSQAAFVAALPFGDTLTELTLSGAELRLLLNQQARVASSRKCQSPIQLSGLALEIHCAGSGPRAVARMAGTGLELDSRTAYTLVTSTYLAEGGSGFDLLTDIALRRALDLDPLDVLLGAIDDLPHCAQAALPCVDPSVLRDGRIVVDGD